MGVGRIMTASPSGLLHSAALSADGTPIGYYSLGAGPGLIIVGGVLSSGSDYRALAELLAENFEVHVMDRRGRANSGPQRQDHSIEVECADLIALARETGATAALGHSFGGLVALETARRQSVFDQLFIYEPGVPLRGQLRLDWLDGYQHRLDAGDRRGAFAWMVKHNGFAPRALAVMPLPYIKAVLRVAIRPQQWASMDRLLEANLTEHRIQAALDSPSPERFKTITAATLLMGGTRSPATISQQLAAELGEVIPNATVMMLPGLDHLAPQHDPSLIAEAVATLGSTELSANFSGQAGRPASSATTSTSRRAPSRTTD
jgi:pimeloyl-ACP methyl ester carboxylesterase